MSPDRWPASRRRRDTTGLPAARGTAAGNAAPAAPAAGKAAGPNPAVPPAPRSGEEREPRPGPAAQPAAAGAPADGGLAGVELARAAVEAALARRRVVRGRQAAAGLDGANAAAPSGTAASSGPASGSGRRRGGYTGPGPDPRDPQPIGSVLARLVKARGWQRPAAEATVFGTWEKLVGPEVASHCRPVRLDNGELTVEAESTAWATQLRLLAGRLLGRIGSGVGPNVVTKLHIHGPATPSWQRGPLRVRGRGPRDTYG